MYYKVSTIAFNFRKKGMQNAKLLTAKIDFEENILRHESAVLG
jgi:hypothetical protein